MSYCRKIKELFVNLRERLGGLTAYTLFKVAKGKVSTEISNKIFLSENKFELSLTEEECEEYYNVLIETLKLSLGSLGLELVLGG